MIHYDTMSHDQVAASSGAGGLAAGEGRFAGLRVPVQPPRLHPAPTLCPARPEGVPEHRLPRGGRGRRGLLRLAMRPRVASRAALFHPRGRRGPAPEKGDFVALLHRATTSAAGRGLIGSAYEAALDATGLESRVGSRYFARRRGNPWTSWTKLAVVCDTASHSLAAAVVGVGPSSDMPQFRP